LQPLLVSNELLLLHSSLDYLIAGQQFFLSRGVIAGQQ